MSTLLMGAFFLAATSMFVSCKDYDDDINANTKAIQNVESTLKAQITELNSALQQEKTAATAAHSQYVDAIAKAQAAADAAQKSLADAIAAANSSHATKTELSEGLAPKANRDEVTAAIAELKTSLNDAINAGDNATAQAAQAALTAAIDKVNASLDGVKGDLATVTNAQTEIKNTLTTAIATLDKKANQTMVDAAVNALNTALAEVKQSAATKEAVQAAIDLAKGEIAKNVQAVEAAAAKAQADATSAQQDLAKLAEKVNTYAAAQAAAETKIEALQKAIETAQALEKTLQSSIADNTADIKVINNQIATLDAQIKSVNENLSVLIAANTNSIQDLAGTVGNIDLQVKALNKFCGDLEALNVTGIRDSMRLSFAALEQAKQTAAQNLADAEVRAAQTAAGYVAALNAVLTARVDSLRDNYATAEELTAAEAAAKTYAKEYVDALDVPALQATVDKMTEDLGESSIADILANLEWVNNTLTWTEDGKVINLEQELKNLNGDIADIAEWQGKIDEFVADVKNNVAGYQTEANVQALIDNAIKDAEGKEKYVALNQLNALLADEAMANVYKTAGVALQSDLTAYLEKGDIELPNIEKVSAESVQQIANAAYTAAQAQSAKDIAAAIASYDQTLADSFTALMNEVLGAQEDAAEDDAAAETPEKAADAIAKLKDILTSSIGVAADAAEAVNVLKIQLSSKLTSLVFYPEAYYGGIESIEITAMRIDNIFNPIENDENKKLGTMYEEFQYKGSATHEYDLYPSGYAKYHINPQNAGIEKYTLSFIDHTAKTRADEAEPMLKPINDGKFTKSDIKNGVLTVEFENDEYIYGRINKATSIPSFAHVYSAATSGSSAVQLPVGRYYEQTHYAYGEGETSGQGVVTALVATNDEDSTEYVASDYALIVPVEINRLVLVSSKQKEPNYWERAGKGIQVTYKSSTGSYTHGVNYGYTCLENTNFHLYTIARDRVELPEFSVNTDNNSITITSEERSDNSENVDKVPVEGTFDLKDYVETHFKSTLSYGASDQKVDDDLFRRLKLAYRFFPIDYTRGTNGTSETLFLTLTEKDENGDFTGVGYFNQVEDSLDAKGNIVTDKNGKGIGKKKIGADGMPVHANNAALGRQPIVRVELYSTDNPEVVYAVGYLRLEISNDVDKEAVSFNRPLNAIGKLYANCGSDKQSLVLTWDQVQGQLNDVIENGLSPEIWNEYKIDGEYNSKGELTYAYQFIDEDGKSETLPVLISKAYQPNNQKENYYPYYYVGSFDFIDDPTTQGIHTKVVKWSFSSVDYQNIYFDANVAGLDNSFEKDENGEFTGVYKNSITRYVRLTHTDSANPDIYVGVIMPQLSLRYAAGSVGAKLNAYWKEAASNKEAKDEAKLNDMIMNVDIAAADASNAKGNLAEGQMGKKLLNVFFGEEIQIDLNLDDLEGDELTAAKRYFKDAKSYYSDARFYFRNPGTHNDAEVNKLEAAVINADGEWTVTGLSGNVYTLAVTDNAPISNKYTDDTKFFFAYGQSVSVIKINGYDLNDERAIAALNIDDPDIKAAVSEAIDDVQMGTTKNKVKAIRVMFIGKDSQATLLNYHPTVSWENGGTTSAGAVTSAAYAKISDDPTTTTTTATNGLPIGGLSNADRVVKGISQDLLNYARHDEAGSTSRPYNMQLTGFVALIADNGGLVGSLVDNHLKKTEDNSDDPISGWNCFVQPAHITNCFFCEAVDVTTEETAGNFVFPYCYKPVVKNTTFAVRFYKPVDIIGLSSKTIKDAELKTQIPQEVPYAGLLQYIDWANYSNSATNTVINGVKVTNMANFLDYYGIQAQILDDLLASHYTTALADANTDVKAVADKIKTDVMYNALGLTATPGNQFGEDKDSDGDVDEAEYIAKLKKLAQDAKTAAATNDAVTKIDEPTDVWPVASVSGKYTDGSDGPTAGTAVGGEAMQLYWYNEQFASLNPTATDKETWTKRWEALKAGYEWSDKGNNAQYEMPVKPTAADKTEGTYQEGTIDSKTKKALEKPAFTETYQLPYTYQALGLNGEVSELVTVLYKDTEDGDKYRNAISAKSADGKSMVVVADNKINTSGTLATLTKYIGEPDFVTSGTTYGVTINSKFVLMNEKPARSSFDDDATFESAVKAYNNYKYDQLAYDTYYGKKKINPAYVEKPAGVDNRTAAQKQKYLYTNEYSASTYPAYDIDGDLTKFIRSNGTTETVDTRSTTDVATVQKYLEREDGVYAQYQADLDEYGDDLVAWKAAIATEAGQNYLKAKFVATKLFNGKLGETANNPTETSLTNLYTSIPTTIAATDDIAKNKFVKNSENFLSTTGKQYEQNLKVIAINKIASDASGLQWYNVVLGGIAYLEKTTLSEEMASYVTKENATNVSALVDALMERDAEFADKSTAAQKALKAIKDNCRVDLDRSNRTPLTDRAAIEALPTIMEACPSLDLVFTTAKNGAEGVNKTSFYFQYTNGNYSTNNDFHIYFPLQVTYDYANEAPAAPIIVWSYITVTGTQGNDTTK